MTPELTGYADQWGVQPGRSVRFMVSTDLLDCEAAIVRLFHVDENLAGPGYEEEMAHASVNRACAGRQQIGDPGSFITVADQPAWRQLGRLTFQMWIYPTAPQKGEAQGLITKWSAADGRGYGLGIGEGGDLEFWIGDDAGRLEHVVTSQPVRAKPCYCPAAACDADRHSLHLHQYRLSNSALETSARVVEKRVQSHGPVQGDAPSLIANACVVTVAPQRMVGRGLQSGKLDSPRLFARALTPSEIERLAQREAPHKVAGVALVAAWDIANKFAASRALDTGPHGLHGAAVNMPVRAVTGHNWSGGGFDFRHAPAEYRAICFHEDDFDDAHWEADFEWTVPASLRSGRHAARLTAGDQQGQVTFIARPKHGTAAAPIAFFQPTLTYLGCPKQRMECLPRDKWGVTDRVVGPGPLDDFLAGHLEFARAAYDHHNEWMRCIPANVMRPFKS